MAHQGGTSTYSAATGDSGGDAAAGGKDVDEAAVVGEGRAGISRGGGADGAGGGGRGGRVVGSVRVVVASGDTEEDAAAHERGSGRVERGRVATAQGHVDDDTVGAAAAGRVGDNKVHAADDARVGARAGRVEDLDGVELGLLGDTVLGSADGAGAVGSVAVAISVAAVDKVASPGGTATKVLGHVSVLALCCKLVGLSGHIPSGWCQYPCQGRKRKCQSRRCRRRCRWCCRHGRRDGRDPMRERWAG